MMTPMPQVDIVAVLLALITLLLGVIGFFMAAWYKEFKKIVADVHNIGIELAKATTTIAHHGKFIDSLIGNEP